MGFRRVGREAVVKILYSLEFAEKDGKTGSPTPDAVRQATDDYWGYNKGSKTLREYADSLIEGITSNFARIDALIAAASKNWEVDRLPFLDRNILRLAVYELLELKDLPTAVIIDEAVEIAKEYGGEESSSFINGILGFVQKEARGT